MDKPSGRCPDIEHYAVNYHSIFDESTVDLSSEFMLITYNYLLDILSIGSLSLLLYSLILSLLLLLLLFNVFDDAS